MKPTLFSRLALSERKTELLLFVICAALAGLLHFVVGFKMVVLNLFYLPIVLGAFYLGRQKAAILALICVLFASIAAVCNLEEFASTSSPAVIGLAIIVWAAVLGLNSIFVGTLSDERAASMAELHDAYLGVVEVLAQYLKSADPEMSDRSIRISNMCQDVARQLRMPERQVDDVRVAALLQDIEHIEVTAKVIRRAVGDLKDARRTFQGSDLVHSLGSVLTGALPLILNDAMTLDDVDSDNAAARSQTGSLGAMVVRTVSRLDDLLHGPRAMSVEEALRILQTDLDADESPAVIHALEQLVRTQPERFGEIANGEFALVGEQ